MAGKNISLINKLTKKNIKDTVILGIITILIITIIILVENKTTMIISILAILLVFFVQYQISENNLTKSIDDLIENEHKEFHEISVKAICLNEKQKQLINKYSEILNNAMQITKSFKTNTMETKEKTQVISARMQEAYDYSNKELKSLNENIIIMQNLKQKIQQIAEFIIELTEYIKQVGSAVNIVENISEQTNILALNAAVEAARAGEYGKGFAVVAGEIRKLADESKQATNKIISIVSEIEQTTSSVILATEDGAKEIDADVKFVLNINSNISDLVEKIKELNLELSGVLLSSVQQQTITSDVIESIDNMQKNISEIISNINDNIENIKVFSATSTDDKYIKTNN